MIMDKKRKTACSMRKRAGIVCMILGTALLLAALSLFLWNRKESREAEESVKRILPEVVEQIRKPGSPDRPEEGTGDPDPYDPAMTEVEIDGSAYIGYLSLPALGLELPVMAEWDYTRLRIAPCRYTGSAKTGNLVICAHNYDRHFGPIRNLASGDEVYFTDMDGVVWQYAVETVDILAPTDIDSMTAGEYDLTLFTCTYGGQSRVTVRCMLEKGGLVLMPEDG